MARTDGTRAAPRRRQNVRTVAGKNRGVESSRGRNEINKIARIKTLLGKVFDRSREDLRAELPPDEYERRRFDFVFHMTDWKDDLEWLAEWYRNPTRHSAKSAEITLIGWLYHVVPHLNAAGRLLLDHIEDPFADDYDDNKKQDRSPRPARSRA